MIKENAIRRYSNKVIDEFTRDSNVLIAGSTYKEDENLIRKISQEINYKVILIPHELDNINSIKKIDNSICLSEASNRDLNINSFKILIIDKIGILSRLYRYGDIAYVGGGFNMGVHNVIEPIAYNIPVIFGPHYYKSIEAKELINIGIGKEISKQKDIINAIRYYEKTDIKELITRYLRDKIGATETIIKNI